MQHVKPFSILLGGKEQGNDTALIKSIDDEGADNSALEFVPPGCLKSCDCSQQQEQGLSPFAAIEHRQRSMRRNDSVPAGLGICIMRDEIDCGCTGADCGDIKYYVFDNGALAYRIAVLQPKKEQQEYQYKVPFHAAQEESCMLLLVWNWRNVQFHWQPKKENRPARREESWSKGAGRRLSLSTLDVAVLLHQKTGAT